MSEEAELKRRQGPVTVLTLLFGLLVGFAGGTGAQLQPDPGTARLGTGEILRTGAAVRIARSGEEDPDPDDALALVPPAPRVVTLLALARAASATAGSGSRATAVHPHLGYRARAPPAA